MRFVVLAAMITCACGALIIGLWVFDPVRMENERIYRAEADAIALAKQRAEALVVIERQKAETAAYVAVVEAVRLPLTLAIIALMLLGGAGGGLFLFAKGVQAWLTRDLIHADKRGLFSVTRAGLNSVATISITGYHAANIEAARNPPLPSSVEKATIYQRPAPPLSNVAPQLVAPQQTALPSTPVVVPSFRDLLRLTPERVALGVTREGETRALTLDAIGAALVIGQRGSGKSNTLACLAAQCASNLGADLWVIDRHARLDQSLTQRLDPLSKAFLVKPGVTSGEIASILSRVEAELDERLGGSGDNTPMVLVVDEINDFYDAPGWNDIGAQIGRLTQRIANAGRKINLGILAAGHLSHRDGLGGHLAYTVSTFIAHKSVGTLVGRFIGADMARHTNNLAPGEVVARHTGGTERLIVPQVGLSDMQYAASLLDRRWQTVSHVNIKGGANDSAAFASTPQPPALNETETRLLTLAVNQFGGSFPVGRLFDQVREDITKPTVDTVARQLEKRGLLTAPGQHTQGGQVARRLTQAGYAALGRVSAYPADTQTAISEEE